MHNYFLNQDTIGLLLLIECSFCLTHEWHLQGGSGNFHMGRPVKGPSKFLVGQQEWCKPTWGRISFG